MPFLLERLAQAPAFDGSRPFDLREAVAAQIQRIVSARSTGAGVDLLGFGMPSAVELEMYSKPQLERYAQRLALLIARHEPRLLAPRVKIESVGQPLGPYRLAIYGSLDDGNGTDVFHFELPSH
ncbi:type VI secretion system baseplate subunit TssE [Burkholderia sp. 22PA0099]|uniref:GPW/gp25 family protein n=1 Tax=unclassified Burkholderia TaxID=2613784 RepID=UPI0039C4B269